MGRSKAEKLNISDLCRERQLKLSCGNSVMSETGLFLPVKPSKAWLKFVLLTVSNKAALAARG